MATEVAYCMKCRSKRDMAEATEVTFKGRGQEERRAVQGTCPTCGTKMFKILGKKN